VGFLESGDSQQAENAGGGGRSLEEVYDAVVMVNSYQLLALFLDSDQHCINKINLWRACFIITTHILMWAGIPGLRAGLSGDQIRAGAISVLVQTGPQAHPAS
jgi:hypothetical protein